MRDERLYLQDFLQRIEMIEAFTVNGQEEFFSSLMVQESVIRCFEVMGEIVKRLSPELLAQHPEIHWSQLAGFRDFLIHNYAKVNLNIVWQSVVDDIPAIRQAVVAILEFLEK